MIGLLALLAAATGHVPTGNGTPNFDGWPPARFAGGNAARVYFTTQAVINRKCDDIPDPPGFYTEACSSGPHPNTIYAPNPCAFPAGDDYARLLCHELAHLNGWPESHPK